MNTNLFVALFKAGRHKCKENRSIMKTKTFVALLGAEREHAPEKKVKELIKRGKPNRL